MTDSQTQTEIAKPDTQKEIVIRSQAELDKLLDDNYNALDKVAYIEKDLIFDSSIKTNWRCLQIGLIPVAFFKHGVECRNINAGLMSIESNSKITAHDITTADIIKCTHIEAHNLNCPSLRAKTVSAHATKVGRIYSNSVYIRNMPTIFCSYDSWGKATTDNA
jgi:hypothetical protein